MSSVCVLGYCLAKDSGVGEKTQADGLVLGWSKRPEGSRAERAYTRVYVCNGPKVQSSSATAAIRRGGVRETQEME